LGDLTDEGKETIAMGADSISYMKELLDDLLASAKLDAGMTELIIEEIDFTALARETVGRLKFQIEEKKVAVFVKNDLGVARADKKAMTKVFMNLIGNAVNYIGEGPNRKIIIGAKTENAGKIYYVRDNGMGIPEESQKTIFQKFKRGANVGDIGGTGLGLSIVKGNIEAHGGKIWVESMLGKGTTFYFTLEAPGKDSP
jgi:signal transduction histidine kinase